MGAGSRVIFYLAIALGASKTKFRVYVWLAISLLFIIASYGKGLYWYARYFSIPAGSLPFALGALIYFISQDAKTRETEVPKWVNPIPLFTLSMVLAVLVSIGLANGLSFFVSELFVYLNTLICSLLVYALAMGKPLFSFFSKRADKYLGDFSYPFYLLHYQATIVASVMLTGQVNHFKENPTFIAITSMTGILVLMSLVVIHVIDSPVEKVRIKK
jgi:peptidoglycan/LPS O-acetylase OafA/YrhL